MGVVVVEEVVVRTGVVGVRDGEVVTGVVVETRWVVVVVLDVRIDVVEIVVETRDVVEEVRNVVVE